MLKVTSLSSVCMSSPRSYGESSEKLPNGLLAVVRVHAEAEVLAGGVLDDEGVVPVEAAAFAREARPCDRLQHRLESNSASIPTSLSTRPYWFIELGRAALSPEAR